MERFNSTIEPLNITATEVEGKIVHVGIDAETGFNHLYLTSKLKAAAFLYTRADQENTRPFVSSLFELESKMLPVRFFSVDGVKIKNESIQEGFVDGDQLFFDEPEKAGVWMLLDQALKQNVIGSHSSRLPL